MYFETRLANHSLLAAFNSMMFITTRQSTEQQSFIKDVRDRAAKKGEVGNFLSATNIYIYIVSDYNTSRGRKMSVCEKHYSRPFFFKN